MSSEKLSPGKGSAAPAVFVRLCPRLLLAWALGAATGALAAFHAWLFWRRLTEGAFGEPAVVLRWLAGLVLLAVLLALRRLGVPLIRCRKAVTFWLLVLLFHSSAGIVGERSSTIPDAASEPGLLLALPATASVAGMALALVALLPHRGSRRGIDGPAQAGFLPVTTPELGSLSGRLLAHTTRPPPVPTA